MIAQRPQPGRGVPDVYQALRSTSQRHEMNARRTRLIQVLPSRPELDQGHHRARTVTQPTTGPSNRPLRHHRDLAAAPGQHGRSAAPPDHPGFLARVASPGTDRGRDGLPFGTQCSSTHSLLHLPESSTFQSPAAEHHALGPPNVARTPRPTLLAIGCRSGPNASSRADGPGQALSETCGPGRGRDGPSVRGGQPSPGPVRAKRVRRETDGCLPCGSRSTGLVWKANEVGYSECVCRAGRCSLVRRG